MESFSTKRSKFAFETRSKSSGHSLNFWIFQNFFAFREIWLTVALAIVLELNPCVAGRLRNSCDAFASINTIYLLNSESEKFDDDKAVVFVINRNRFRLVTDHWFAAAELDLIDRTDLNLNFNFMPFHWPATFRLISGGWWGEIHQRASTERCKSRQTLSLKLVYIRYLSIARLVDLKCCETRKCVCALDEQCSLNTLFI